jgi:hypothetical protein
MKHVVLVSCCVVFFASGLLNPVQSFGQQQSSPATQTSETDPDMPGGRETSLSREEYLKLRSEHIARLRGLPYKEDNNPRVRALLQLERQEKAALQKTSMTTNSSAWIPLGPAPIPNGQTNGSEAPVSGRVTAIAIHPRLIRVSATLALLRAASTAQSMRERVGLQFWITPSRSPSDRWLSIR